MLRLVLGTMALMVSSTGHAVQPLQPASKWQVDFGQTGCVALRKYGGETDGAHLVLKRYAIGDRYELALIEDGEVAEPLSGEGVISAGGTQTSVPAIRYGDADAGRTVTTWYGDGLAALGAAEQVDLRFGQIVHSLALTQTAKVVEALEQCQAMLGDYYNMDGAVTPAEGSVDVLRDDDWPLLAADRDSESVFRALLLLDEEGKVADCSLLSFAGDALFVARSCGLIRERATFKPATGADGQPIRSAYVTPVVAWRIGKDVSNVRMKEFLRRDAVNEGRNRGPGDSEGVLMRPPGEGRVGQRPN
ncbi:hypothetical protein [Sphingomicrobium marinum]|uniref:hypothetical protein n=1 Tax=Sphingomicrobium marinum TaxID=1227950 RepID=UPI00223F27E1|nr:hypothetical protein [Sphingomicrobium marinum]